MCKKIIKSKEKIIILAVFVFLILFYAINNYFIINKYYNLPLYSDEALHLTTAFKYHEIFKNFSLTGFSNIFGVGDMLYPPLFLISPLSFTLFTGFSKTNAVMVNLIFFIIMLISVYFIGKKISGNKYTGLLSVFILSMFPMAFGMSRYFMLDFALTAMSAFSICCLIYTEGFSNRRLSLLFGISLTLALLTKWSAVIFITGPLICVMSDRYSNLKIKFKIRKKNIVYALLIPVILFGLWGAANFYRLLPVSNILAAFRRGFIGSHQGQLAWYTLSGVSFYLHAFYYQVFVVFFILFFVFVYFFIKAKVKYKNLIFSWILVPYFVLTLIDSKWARYIMPVLPAVAIIIAIGIGEAGNKKLRLFLMCFIIIWGLFQYLIISYVPFEKLPEFISRIIYADKDRSRYYCYSDNTIWFDGQYYASQKAALIEISRQVLLYRDKENLKREFSIGLVWPAKVNSFRYFFQTNSYNDIAMYAFYEEPEKFLKAINSLDIVLLNSPSMNRDWPKKDDMDVEFNKYNFQKHFKLNVENYAVFENNFKRLSNEFKMIGLVKFDAGSYVYIYARKEKKLFSEISNGNLKLFFDQGRGRIFYKDKELTDRDGMHSSFSVKGIYYDSRSAIWKAEKMNSSELSVILQWPGLALRQIWKIGLVDGVLNWQADLVAEENVAINNLSVGIIIRDGYKKWESFYDAGLLPEIPFGQNSADVNLKYPIHFIGLNKIEGDGEFMPVTALNLYGSGILNRISLRNFKDYSLGQKYSLLDIQGKEAQSFFIKGSFSLFSGSLLFYDKQEEFSDYANKIKSSQEISNGSLKLFFDQGRGRIFYKGKELTEGDGVCLLFLSLDKWYASLSNALWSIEKISTNKLLAKSKWEDFPILYSLVFEIEDSGIINCEINTQVTGDMDLKQESFVIMLSDIFKSYISSSFKQEIGFPGFHRDSYSWQDVWRAKTEGVPWTGVVNNYNGIEITLNSIVAVGANFIISNTNKRHSARALIYNKTYLSGEKPFKGQRSFYSGKIKIKS